MGSLQRSNIKNEVKRLVHDPIDESRWKSKSESFLSWIAITATLAACVIVAWEQIPLVAQQIAQQEWIPLFTHGVYIFFIYSLIYGSLIYQITRLAYIHRIRRHNPAAIGELNRVYERPAPALTILIPSYKEEQRVIWQTMISAALQEYPNRRVVLLIDDPPNPIEPIDVVNLRKARRISRHLQSIFNQPTTRFKNALVGFEERIQRGDLDRAHEAHQLAELWLAAADWYNQQANYSIENFSDRLFVTKVLLDRRDSSRLQARKIASGKLKLNIVRLLCEYRKLASLFDVEISCFERKRFLNLSHEPNKAMNLNSYISLIGKHYRVRDTRIGAFLEAVKTSQADFSVPGADYIISLDADSVLLPNYALILIHFMEQPRNSRIAIAQTPYSSFPGSPISIERMAGATTDIQYIIHQGFTYFNSTFWVGANALIRRRALDDITVTETERGYPVQRYIQDNTVIEDTESSVDLVDNGWRLYNYPERLSYSATPPDFGALIIQRRRWANGGLIILPKLVHYLTRRPVSFHKIAEGLMRFHYLVSIALVNLGLIILLTFPLAESVRSQWLPLTALPYFILYAHDLALSGYRGRDMLKVYALNLMLIPVNLIGVIKSIQQALSGRKTPFGRTPKVPGRTAAAPFYILAVYGLCLVWVFGSVIDVLKGFWVHAIFAIANAAFLAYAIVVFVGVKESQKDLSAYFRKNQHD